MKTYIITGLLAVALCVGFASGQATAKKKFPYVSDALNAPCGKTEFEWRCASRAAIGFGKTAVLTSQYVLTDIFAQPGPREFFVTAYVTWNPKFPATHLDTQPARHTTYCGLLKKGLVQEVRNRFADNDSFSDPKTIILKVFCDGNAMAL